MVGSTCLLIFESDLPLQLYAFHEAYNGSELSWLFYCIDFVKTRNKRSEDGGKTSESAIVYATQDVYCKEKRAFALSGF